MVCVIFAYDGLTLSVPEASGISFDGRGRVRDSECDSYARQCSCRSVDVCSAVLCTMEALMLSRLVDRSEELDVTQYHCSVPSAVATSCGSMFQVIDSSKSAPSDSYAAFIMPFHALSTSLLRPGSSSCAPIRLP